MTYDPIQALIDAGAIPTNPFGPNSRYRNIPMGLYQPPAGGAGVAYMLRRFVPQQRDIPAQLEYIVPAGSRPDLLGANLLGDSELYWRIADANAVTDPFELTDTLAARISIPAPPGQ
jgi:hypothetical protein